MPRAMLLAALALMPAAVAQAQPAPYRIDWLGHDFFPHALNDRGQVIGLDLRGRGYGPALRWDNGRVTALGEGEGHDINNLGTAVLGVPVPGQGQPGPWVVTPDGTRNDLGLPQGWGGDFRHEFSINDSGHVVGMQKDPIGSDGRAFTWDGRSVTYLDLGMGNVPISSAHGINNAGQVVGWWSSGVSNSAGGFLWKDGVTTLLPAPAVSINGRGQVLLLSNEIWEGGTTRGPLRTPPLMPVSDPAMAPQVRGREINDAGLVVGWMEEFYLINVEDGYGSIQRGFLWNADGSVVDLDAAMGFGPDEDGPPYQFALSIPTDVNNAGQIVGYGSQGGWLLTPVPEPIGIAALWPAALVLLRRGRTLKAEG